MKKAHEPSASDVLAALGPEVSRFRLSPSRCPNCHRKWYAIWLTSGESKLIGPMGDRAVNPYYIRSFDYPGDPMTIVPYSPIDVCCDAERYHGHIEKVRLTPIYDER